jgi:cellobiose phosphorylase
VPGVRENGGQYTHAAIWTVMATAAMGDGQRAWELFSLINPISHGSTPAEISTYRVEPYVVAADVYGVAPHTGRGGWTWYTGSSGWMYRLIVESLLGLHLEADKLRITPTLPAAWTRFQIHYRYRETFYHITIQNHGADAVVSRMSLDGDELSDDFVTLVDDGRDHKVEVEMWPNEVTAHQT